MEDVRATCVQVLLGCLENARLKREALATTGILEAVSASIIVQDSEEEEEEDLSSSSSSKKRRSSSAAVSSSSSSSAPSSARSGLAAKKKKIPKESELLAEWKSEHNQGSFEDDDVYEERAKKTAKELLTSLREKEDKAEHDETAEQKD